MGLLQPADWTAQWISDSTLADPANRPLTPVHCYRSELASRSDAVKWIVLDLGSSRQMDALDLIPARPRGLHSDFRTVMFPLRFKVEVADNRDFSDARLVVDNTGQDFPNPRSNSCRFQFPALRARYVRLTVTRLARWDGPDYGVALGGFAVFNGPNYLAIGVHVDCSDSIESKFWSKDFLVDGVAAVTLAPDAAALDAGMPDTTKKFTVSRVPMLRREFNLAAAPRFPFPHAVFTKCESTAAGWMTNCWRRVIPTMAFASNTGPATSPVFSGKEPTPSARCWATAGMPDT
jgi:hypothetical protein